MWDAVDSLVERAPDLTALRYHRLQLLAAWRGRADAPELARERVMAHAVELAVPAVLARARAAWDGPLVLVKGPEVALDYPAPATRPFGDLDLLVADAGAAQRALLAAGFREAGDPRIYEHIHHLRPLWWPGTPVFLELHSRPKWPEGLLAPPTGELLAASEPSRLGIAGVETLPTAHHALLLAAHAWAHQPLARAGQLLDVAVTAGRADAAELRALARAWGIRRLWRTTRSAADALLGGSGRTPAWSRHLGAARERTVLERHVQECLAPLWGLPPAQALPAAARGLAGAMIRDEGEGWRSKLARSRRAVGNARLAKSEHDRRLAALGGEGQQP
jgi:hypothetical protein